MSPSKILTDQTLHGFLLSRQWRDTTAGITLEFWASTDIGPVLIHYTSQQAVCFCERELVITPSLPKGAHRQERALSTLSGKPVDALYFKSQRALRDFSEHADGLFETDVSPSNRFLMERFVMASFTLRGDIEPAGQNRRYAISRNPRIVPASYQPTLSMASLDIETNGYDNSLYSIAVAHAGCSVVFMRASEQEARETGAQTTAADENYELRFFINEKELLAEFLQWFADRDPDLIIGWNVVGFDLTLLQSKCQKFDIPFALGRAGETAKILQRSKGGNFSNAPARARVPGRAVLDGIDLLRAGFWSFESFALDNVASEMLGKTKAIRLTGRQKIDEINQQFAHNKRALAAYNIRDCWLVEEIFAHAELLNFAIKRAQMTGLDIDRMGGSVATFDNLYLPRLHRQGAVANDVDAEQSAGLGSPGGYVLDSEPGLYRNVIVLDFKSLYPSIIRTFLIDPLGLQRSKDEQDPIAGFLGAEFSRQHSILPDLVGELWQQRDLAKAESDSALSQAIKIIMNSLYGVLGTPACRFFDPLLASSITLRGHQIITDTQELIEQQHQFKVIYGDTDSLFILLPEDYSEARCQKVGNHLAENINEYWHTSLRKEFGLPCFLEVEFETLYLRFVMPTIRGAATGSKKRYAGLVRNKAGDTEAIFKGLEAARTDWTPLAREFQRELYLRVFHDQPYTDWVKSIVRDVLSGVMDDKLVYRKRLRRPIDDYQKNVPPHVRAARQLENPGKHIEYLITLAGPQPCELQSSAPDYQHYLDRQLAPAADGLLHFLGTSFDTITSQQLSIFE